MGSDITVIIPVHEIDSSTEGLYANAITSLAEQEVLAEEVLIVVPAKSDAEKFVSAFDYGDIKDSVRIIKNTGKTDFASQFNLGVEESNTDWVSFLEYDDEFSKIWLKHAVAYRECYDDIDMFLPIVVDKTHDNKFIGFTNEAVWAHEFSDELGIIDENALLMYQNFNIDGMVVRKEILEDFGNIKSNIKLTFIYEFLLRMAHNGMRIMTIPKFGYKHINLRPSGLFDSYKKDMTPDEHKFWMTKARKEYFHTTEREITYTPEQK